MKRLAIAMGGGVLMALVAVATHPSPAPATQASYYGPAPLVR